MSKQYDNTNRGALFDNERKEKDTHPDYSGNLNVDGKEYWVSGWEKLDNNGDFKLISLSVKPKESQQDSQRTQASSRRPHAARSNARRPIDQGGEPGGGGFDPDFADDDIPF